LIAQVARDCNTKRENQLDDRKGGPLDLWDFAQPVERETVKVWEARGQGCQRCGAKQGFDKLAAQRLSNLIRNVGAV